LSGDGSFDIAKTLHPRRRPVDPGRVQGCCIIFSLLKGSNSSQLSCARPPALICYAGGPRLRFTRSFAADIRRLAGSLLQGGSGRSNTMIHWRTVQTTIYAAICAIPLITLTHGTAAHAQISLDANYTISLAHIRVGYITANLVLGDGEYKISARGHAGGIMKAIMDGEGTFTTVGTITDGHPTPTSFSSKIFSGREKLEVTMLLDEARVKELNVVPPVSSGRVPVRDSNRQGVIDPLTALLFSAGAVADGLSKEGCRRTLPIFDGQQRYDLKLAFKRVDTVVAEKGYAGPVLVCSLRYEPIVGHYETNTLVKYLAEGREMEITLAPVYSTRMLAPFRLSVVSMLGNVLIEANRFEATARSPDASTVADP
jgi:hypothetical protein